MEPSKIVHCKQCGLDIPAFTSVRSKAKKERKWEDSNGRFFNGRTCPDCHASNMRERQKEYMKRLQV